MQVHPALDMIRRTTFFQHFGDVTAVGQNWIEAKGPHCAVGQFCKIATTSGQDVLAEVVSIDRETVRLLPLSGSGGIRPGARAKLAAEQSLVQVGDGFIGRAIDAFAQPIDGKGPIQNSVAPRSNSLPDKLDRIVVPARVSTGLRAIDGILPLAKGQRIGVFAASGVGKTTLVEQISRSVECDHCVICLVGERGREVERLWQLHSSVERRSRVTLVAATSDESATARIRAAEQALALCEHWRAQGKHVVLFVDSMTRLAMALREIGLAAGEPPTLRSYTPNVFSALPRFVERCGADRNGGAITAIFSVLAETDDVDDPIVELFKSLLDGHLVLSRQLAERSHFPAIDIGASVSRLIDQLLGPEALQAARQLRQAFAELEAARPMIDSGIYRPGSNPQIDKAIALEPKLAEFLTQTATVHGTMEAVDKRMIELCRGAER